MCSNGFTLIIILCIAPPNRARLLNNACKTFKDYPTMQTNPSCWHDPDIRASPEKIVANHGYPFESYELITADGYVLTLQRIPPINITTKNNPPVLLQHGIAGDSTAFLLSGANSGAFILSDNGFDVWMSNSRGSLYSLKHVNYSTDDPQFWNFSFHEIAIYDLPKIIEFIAEKTGKKGDITYIGHSMGTTMSYVYASMKPKHAKKYLRRIISLSPIAYLGNATTVGRMLAPLYDFIRKALLPRVGIGYEVEDLKSYSMRICGTYPTGTRLCEIIIRYIAGDNLTEIFTPETLNLVLSHIPSSMSFKCLWHYFQLLQARAQFSLYDYGEENNLKLYNLPTPPEYNLSKINIPVHLFYGKADVFSDKKDVKYLFEQLKTTKTITGLLDERDVGHFDFAIGGLVKKIFTLLLPYLNDKWDKL